MAALLVKPSYDPVMETREEKGEPQEQEMNLLNIGKDSGWGNQQSQPRAQ